MSLDALDTKIVSFRDDAANLIQNFRAYEATINADPTLTLEGKNQKLDGRKDRVREEVAALQDREKAAVAAEIQSLERTIGGTVSASGGDVISFRDAQDRAARASGPAEALAGILSAITTHDRELARAYLVRAMNERDQDPIAQALGSGGYGAQWSQVVDEYINAYPAATQAVTDLFTIRRRERNPQFRFSGAGAYVIF